MLGRFCRLTVREDVCEENSAAEERQIGRVLEKVEGKPRPTALLAAGLAGVGDVVFCAPPGWGLAGAGNFRPGETNLLTNGFGIWYHTSSV